jgi:hypothetical protein
MSGPFGFGPFGGAGGGSELNDGLDPGQAAVDRLHQLMLSF